MPEFYQPPNTPLYLTPDSIPVGRFCRRISVPDSPEWVGLVDGVLSVLFSPDAWRQNGALTPDEAAEEWQRMVLSAWTGDDCITPCPVVWRIDVDGVYQYSEDGGETWTTDEDPMGPPEPRTEPTDEEKKCAAAANAAYVYRQLYDQAVEYYNDNVEPALALTSLVSGVMLGIFFPPAVPFVEAIFGIAYSVLEYFTSGQFDDDIEREFKCILIDEANVAPDGTVTFEFEDVRTLVNAKMFENPVWIAISYFLNTFGEDALNRAGATTAVEDADCADCGDGWCYRWDFRDSLFDWTIPVSGVTGNPLGEWVPGMGIKVVAIGGGFSNYAYPNRDFGDGPLVEFRRVGLNVVECETGFLLRLRHNADISTLTDVCELGEHVYAGGGGFLEDEGVLMTTDGAGVGDIYIQYFEVGSSSGSNPFGEDNCDT